MIIKQSRDMTQNELIAVQNSNNSFLSKAYYPAGSYIVSSADPSTIYGGTWFLMGYITYGSGTTIGLWNCTVSPTPSAYDFAAFEEYVTTHNADLAAHSAAMALKADKVSGTWITPTLINGWTSVPSYPVRYMIDVSGIVHFEGRAQGGAAGTKVFATDVGYRPTYDRSVLMAHGSNTGAIRGLLNIGGALYVEGAYTSYVDLSGISFKAA